MKYFDIYIVGVGGQGVLTIADIITLTAAKKDVPVNYYPTKGMAQRGGFVKAQLRIGRKPLEFSPSIPLGGADLIVSMEVNETLKAIKYAKKGAEYVLCGLRWEPTAVMLGKAPYPDVETVEAEIYKAKGEYTYISPESIGDMRGNLFILGTMYACTKLKEMFSQQELEQTISDRWPKVSEANIATFRAGMKI